MVSPIPSAPPPADRSDDGLLDGIEDVGEMLVLGSEGEVARPWAAGTFTKIVQGMIVLVLLVLLPYAMADEDEALARHFELCDEGEPDCAFARAWIPGEPVPFWNVIGRELLGEGRVEEEAQADLQETEALAQALLDLDASDAEPAGPAERRILAAPAPGVAAELPEYEPHPDDGAEVEVGLEMPSSDALDSFFESLARTDAGYEGAVTRVVQWGDSVIAADHVTSALRTEMQRRFGDAGHGFHLLVRPNPSYHHQGVKASSDAWQFCYIINKCRTDGHYGLGGTTASAVPGQGARASFATASDGAYGRAWSRVEIWYAGQPAGGQLHFTLDGRALDPVDTAATALEDRWHVIEMEDGEHELDVRPKGKVRAYGVVLERDGPGVVWDGMEQLGAFTSRMKYFDAEHLRRQVEHRDPDLLVFMFGGNDLSLTGASLDKYPTVWAEVLERFRGPGDGPRRACLVVAPVDHGERKGQRIESRPEVATIVEHQRKAALAAGCAFFDTPKAMGGEGAVARWRRAEKPLIAGDLSHLTNAGQKVIGHYVYLALMQRYVEYRLR